MNAVIKRDKLNLDIFWLKDDALEDGANLPAPEVIAREIAEDLRTALDERVARFGAHQPRASGGPAAQHQAEHRDYRRDDRFHR